MAHGVALVEKKNEREATAGCPLDAKIHALLASLCSNSNCQPSRCVLILAAAKINSVACPERYIVQQTLSLCVSLYEYRLHTNFERCKHNAWYVMCFVHCMYKRSWWAQSVLRVTPGVH